jgi:proline racemase
MVAGVNTDISSVDYHTAGEPFRIVTTGVPEIRGATVRDRREYARATEAVDRVRRLLCHEPRGHADMYGCFPVPPDDDGAHLGVLFWHKDGYSTACGHGTIALATWLVQSGQIPSTMDGETELVIDVPSGRVAARVTRRSGVVERVAFRNVPSYVLARDVAVETPRGSVRVDVSYGGAIYASVAAARVGLRVTAEHYHELIAIGRAVTRALDAGELARHPSDERLSGVYGTILYDELGDTPDGPHQRNVTVFADGEVDRSPCGSGTCARVALLSADGRLGEGQAMRNESIIGTRFLARIVERAGDAVVVEVEGSAYRTGEHRFVLDKADPIGTGFILR